MVKYPRKKWVMYILYCMIWNMFYQVSLHPAGWEGAKKYSRTVGKPKSWGNWLVEQVNVKQSREMSPGRFFMNNTSKWPQWVFTVRNLLLLCKIAGSTSKIFTGTLWFWIPLVATKRISVKILQEPGIDLSSDFGGKITPSQHGVRRTPLVWQERRGIRGMGQWKYPYPGISWPHPLTRHWCFLGHSPVGHWDY